MFSLPFSVYLTFALSNPPFYLNHNKYLPRVVEGEDVDGEALDGEALDGGKWE